MADYLTDEEQAERIKKWIRDYGITIALAIVLGIGGVVGWNYFQSYTGERSEISSNLYLDYVEARALGEPVQDFISTLREDHPRSTYFAYALLFEAKDAVESERFEDAVAILDEAGEVVSDKSLSDMILVRKARVQSEIEDYTEALETLRGVQTEGYRASALEVQGDIFYRQQELDKAREAYTAAKEALSSEHSDEMILTKIASLPAG